MIKLQKKGCPLCDLAGSFFVSPVLLKFVEN